MVAPGHRQKIEFGRTFLNNWIGKNAQPRDGFDVAFAARASAHSAGQK